MSKQTCALCGNTADERYMVLSDPTDSCDYRCISADKCQRRQRANAKANAEAQTETETVEPTVTNVEAPVTEVVDGEQVVVPVPTDTISVAELNKLAADAYTEYHDTTPYPDETWTTLTDEMVRELHGMPAPMGSLAPADPKDKRAVVRIDTVHTARVTEHWVICTHCGDVAHRRTRNEAERARLFHIDEKHRF